MNAKQLIAEAAKCQACGVEHKVRRLPRSKGITWASPVDHHTYRPLLSTAALQTLRMIEGQLFPASPEEATGEHIDPTTVQRTGPENAGEARHGE